MRPHQGQPSWMCLNSADRALVKFTTHVKLDKQKFSHVSPGLATVFDKPQYSARSEPVLRGIGFPGLGLGGSAPLLGTPRSSSETEASDQCAEDASAAKN